jgi:hypothetical protein
MLTVEPASKLTDADREMIRQHKAACRQNQWGKQHLQLSGARQTRDGPLPALMGTMRNKID